MLGKDMGVKFGYLEWQHKKRGDLIPSSWSPPSVSSLMWEFLKA
jgi:hypothetical protein